MERTFGWFSGCRRLNYEILPQTSEAFVQTLPFDVASFSLVHFSDISEFDGMDENR